MAATAVVLLLLTGCVPRVAAPSDAESPAPDRVDVQWADYAPDLQDRIDALEAAGDCGELQNEFDTADANNAATHERTGHNNTQLMKYIDEALRAAGCY